MSAIFLHNLPTPDSVQHDHVEACEAILQCAGGFVIGSGYFSSVFRMPAVYVSDGEDVRLEDRVVKLSCGDGGGYHAALAAMEHCEHDPLAPKVYGVRQLSPDMWAAEMELLAPLDRNEYGDPTTDTVTNITGGGFRRIPLDEIIVSSPYLLAVRELVDKGAADWDVHSYNVMMRGNQPVVSDPCFLMGEIQ